MYDHLIGYVMEYYCLHEANYMSDHAVVLITANISVTIIVGVIIKELSGKYPGNTIKIITRISLIKYCLASKYLWMHSMVNMYFVMRIQLT